MVAAVATLDPETEPNSAQEPMFECISPPGSQESHWTSALYMRVGDAAAQQDLAEHDVEGMAVRMKLVVVDQASSPMAMVAASANRAG